MSEIMSAEIVIGGGLKRELLGDFLQACEDDGAAHAYGETGAPQDEKELDEIVRGNDGYLRLYNAEAKWGEFDTLERFCQEHGLDYTRTSEGISGYDPEIVVFRKWMKEERYFLTTANGDLCITKAGLENIFGKNLNRLLKMKAKNIHEKLLNEFGTDILPVRRFNILSE